MATYQEYNTKAAASLTKVRRTFILTFALMFLTLTVMYGTTELFSQKMLVYRNANSSFASDGKIIKSEIAPNAKKSDALENAQHMIASSWKTAPSVVTSAIDQGYQGKGSKEFPDMPDPCATPRRNTGVEDILCMKRPQYLPEFKNPCWMDGTTFRCLPYFYLIGICKSGTSDFFKRLLLHPDIIPNKGIFGKETRYWTWERFEVHYVKEKVIQQINEHCLTNNCEKQERGMATYQEYNTKAAASLTKVRRTFILTFALMFLTLTVMYGTTELFSQKMLVYRNANSSFASDGKIIKSEIAPNAKKSDALENAQHMIASSWKTAPSVVTSAIDQGYQGKGSKEFPDMPDPCATPRRNTGVEDILCMKRPQYLPEFKNPCWMDGTTFRCLPYFYLIGICKSGTSDFFKRLLLHPDIIPNKGIFGKETRYGTWERFEVKKRAGKIKLRRTLKEFTSQFDVSKIRYGVDEHGYHNMITGHGDPMDIWNRFREEATPQNVPGAEELLWTTPYAVRHINPYVKLLLMLRDPIDRLYSHYLFHSKMGTTAQNFHDHVVQSIGVWKNCLQGHTIRHCIYSPQILARLRAPIHTSFYIVHLREWLKVFPRQQLFIFRNEDYSSDIKGTMRKVFTFLDVSIPDESLFNKMEKLPHFYETKSKKRAGPMLASTKALLVNLYRPYTEELATFLKDENYAFKDRSFA